MRKITATLLNVKGVVTGQFTHKIILQNINPLDI